MEFNSHSSKAFGKFESLSVRGTVSPDIAFYFRVYKCKSALSVRPVMVF